MQVTVTNYYEGIGEDEGDEGDGERITPHHPTTLSPHAPCPSPYSRRWKK